MTFLMCDPGWCIHKSGVQNKWDDNTHICKHTNSKLLVFPIEDINDRFCMRVSVSRTHERGRDLRRTWHFLYLRHRINLSQAARGGGREMDRLEL